MNAAASLAATYNAATDHGRPLVTIAGVHLVDVRADFPSVPVERTMTYRDPSLVAYVSQHHDAAFYPDDPLPGDDFNAEMDRLAAVWRYHRFTQGWGGIGYHTYGFPSGRLYLVGDLSTQRANVARDNHRSIGHCSAGLFSSRIPPLGTQLSAALATIAAWGYLRRMVPTLAHADVAQRTDPTECCGATRALWVPRLPEAIARIAPTLQR